MVFVSNSNSQFPPLLKKGTHLETVFKSIIYIEETFMLVRALTSPMKVTNKKRFQVETMDEKLTKAKQRDHVMGSIKIMTKGKNQKSNRFERLSNM